MRSGILAAGFAAAVLAAGPALGAEEHEVKMLNRGEEGPMVFEPAFLKIEPGDSVRFVPTDMTHNSESIAGMIPEGAEPWKGRINEEITVTFDVPGIYGYKCLPHYGMGKIGLILVGDEAPNLEEAQSVRHPGIAARRFTALFETLEEELAN